MFICIIIGILLLAAFLLIDSRAELVSQDFNATSTNVVRRQLYVNYWRELQSFVSPEVLSHIVKNNTQYQHRKPFPYIVIDGLWPLSILSSVELEVPDTPVIENGCSKNGAKCFNRGKYEQGENTFENSLLHGPATTALFSYMKSSVFITFLEQLSRIHDLIPDPHFRGSGIHQTLPNGYLGIHADFNRYDRYNLHRRINIYIYLNPQWEDEYGGHLEFWSKDLQYCYTRIRPDLGRIVIFASTDFSYHGHPKPLTCPSHRSRRALALSYYTRNRPARECVHYNCNYAQTTLFQQIKCEDCSLAKCQKNEND
jgi:hypothetical protein